MAFASLDEIDKRIQEQKERLDTKPEEPTQTPTTSNPWNDKMREAFETEIQKGEKCRACNWMNTGEKVILVNYINVMRERLPIPSIICRQCGSIFVPKWARKIMMQAIELENKILKQRGAGTRGD